MTLANVRAAFEKAITDAVAAADNTVIMSYDNVTFTTPGKTKNILLLQLFLTNQNFNLKVQLLIIMLDQFNVIYMYQKEKDHQYYQH